MKAVFQLLLVLLLAWGLWALLGSEPEDTGELDPDAYLMDDGGGRQPAKGVGAEGVDPATQPRGIQGAEGQTPGETDAADAQLLRLHGRVVDGQRQPLAEVAVELRIATRTLVRATTDAEGSYRLAVHLPRGQKAERAFVLARRTGYGTAVGAVWLATAGIQTVPAIVLDPAHPLRVRVEVDGKPSPFAQVAVATRAGGAVTALAVRAAGSDGTVMFDGLAAGLYEVYATLPTRGRGKAFARLPQAPGEFAVVSLGAERYLDVIVEDAQTGRPIEGAVVTVGDKSTLPAPTGPGYLPPLPKLVTHRQGRVSVRGLASAETLYANAEAAGYLPGVWWRASAQVARPGTNEVHVRLHRHRTVTFPIYVGEAGAPDDGAVLRVETAGRTAHSGASAATGRVDGAYAVVEGLPRTSMAGVLLAPDGRQARFNAPAGADAGPAVEFLDVRTVRVRIVESGGAPVADLGLRLNPLDGLAQVAPATTDEDGVAVFEGVAARKVGVHVRVADSPWGGPLLGRIDLSDGQATYEFELEAQLGFRLMLTINGEPALPGRYALLLGGRRVPLDEIAEDPRSGTLEVSVRPPPGAGTLRGVLNATGYLPASFDVDSSAAAGQEVELELAPAGRIVATVTPPKDSRYGLGVQLFDPATKAWRPVSHAPGPGLTPPAAQDGVHAFNGLAAGRYRLVEARSGYQSRSLDVAAGGGVVRVAVDLSSTLAIEGRVVAPAGTNLALARVLVEGRHAAGGPSAGIRVGNDGRFQLQALGGDSLVLRVTHPTLSAAARGGSATVRAGRGGVELRLEAGLQATFRVAGFEAGQGSGAGPWQAPVQVKLYKGKVGGELVLAVQPVASQGTFTFGGFPPGTYAVWIGLGTKHAPFTRTGVSFATGTTDLGLIAPSEGTTLTVELEHVGSPSAIWATLTLLGEPSYKRSASVGADRSILTLRGLGKGTFRLLVQSSSSQGAQVLHDSEITLSGTGTRRLRVGRR